MFGFMLVFVGLFYVIAQYFLAMSLQGYWRAAAILPVPVLAILIGSAVGFGSVLPLDSTTLLLIGPPMALVYLTLLCAIHFVVRLAEAERSHDPVGNRFGK